MTRNQALRAELFELMIRYSSPSWRGTWSGTKLRPLPNKVTWKSANSALDQMEKDIETNYIVTAGDVYST